MNKYWVIETYPDPVGGTWKHGYPTLGWALEAMDEMKIAHPHRTYELVEE